MPTNNDARAVAVKVLRDKIKRDLPGCFKFGNDKRPLKVRIDKDVIAYYASDLKVNLKYLKRALAFYVNNHEYLAAMKDRTH